MVFYTTQSLSFLYKIGKLAHGTHYKRRRRPTRTNGERNKQKNLQYLLANAWQIKEVIKNKDIPAYDIILFKKKQKKGRQLRR